MSDELGFNKIAGAILATALAFIGIKEISHAAYHPHVPETPAYGAELLAAAEAAGKTKTTAPVDLPFPQADWIAAMDADKGANVAKKCASCHSFDKGGKQGTGPNLYGILGTAAASNAGFTKYSSAMKDSGVTWGYAEMDEYLTKPSKYIKGTAMSFNGLKKPAQRAAMIEYLRVSSDAPMDRPVAALVEAVPMEEAPMKKDESHGEGEH